MEPYAPIIQLQTLLTHSQSYYINTLNTAQRTVTQQRPEVISTVNILVCLIKMTVCAIKNIRTITLSYLKKLTIIPVSNNQTIQIPLNVFCFVFPVVGLIDSGTK